MIDKYGRSIDYLRVSITDRCNLRCIYCMPPKGVTFKPHSSILRYEEIIKIVEVGTELGIKKVRITGGEPLVREGVVDLIKKLREIPALEDITMTTNGVLLPKYAFALKRAGLSRVNISLDSLNADIYKTITRRDEFSQAIEGIKAALEAALGPVKINTVVMKGLNDTELESFVNLTIDRDLHVRFIEYMPMGETSLLSGNYYVSLNEFKEKIINKTGMVPADIKNNGPSKDFKVPGAKGTVGFITAISHNFCSTCNRMRLTAAGFLRPCLASDVEVNMRDEDGKISTKSLREKFEKALFLKPVSHNFYKNNFFPKKNMSQIGG
ncbi:MAG TPA: GTP 3',8-cyclase MoaA [Petrotoga sp.]|nr:MAG: Cyclic pyranopterin monophosphate synthase [Petrotoga mobilis]HBT51589.1 GTP 3',8-cyclase MoaA [Petrotoga sp.]